MNGPAHVARLVLGTRPTNRYCLTEIALINDDSMGRQLAIYQPTVGVVTNIGGDHLSAYGGIDGVAEEKSKLIRALPPNGIAILNADDSRVIAMQALFSGRTVTYGMGEQAMLRGTEVESSWPDRLSLTVTWLGQSVRVETQLCGVHWAPVVLAAIATAVALGVPLPAAAEALATVKPFEGRMSPVELEDGVTFIRDDWKAPFWTVEPTLAFMRHARAKRKIVVVGTLSDYTGDSSKRYSEVARKALDSADCVLFVGPRSSASLRAKRNDQDQLFAFPAPRCVSVSVLVSPAGRPRSLERLHPRRPPRTPHPRPKRQSGVLALRLRPNVLLRRTRMAQKGRSRRNRAEGLPSQRMPLLARTLGTDGGDRTSHVVCGGGFGDSRRAGIRLPRYRGGRHRTRKSGGPSLGHQAQRGLSRT